MSGVALVKVCAGRGLKACDSNGKSDPYVNFRLQSQKKDTKQRTKVIEKTLEPVWNEEFKLPFTTLADNIVFHLWDKDRFSNDSMGQVTLSLAECTPGSRTSRWLKLEDVETGEILVEVDIPPGHYNTQPPVKDMLPLIPQTPSIAPLIEGSVVPHERGFVIQEQFWSFSTHDNKIFDESGNFVLNVDGKAMSLHGRMTLESPQGQPLLAMGGKAFSLHATQCVFLPGQDHDVSEDKAIMVVKAKMGNRFQVTRQGKEYFNFKFNWLGHKGVFTNAAGEVIGQVAARLFQHYQAQTFHLRCAAGTDSLAMLCAVVLADKIMDDRRRAQQHGPGPHGPHGPRPGLPMHF